MIDRRGEEFAGAIGQLEVQQFHLHAIRGPAEEEGLGGGALGGPRGDDAGADHVGVKGLVVSARFGGDADAGQGIGGVAVGVAPLLDDLGRSRRPLQLNLQHPRAVVGAGRQHQIRHERGSGAPPGQARHAVVGAEADCRVEARRRHIGECHLQIGIRLVDEIRLGQRKRPRGQRRRPPIEGNPRGVVLPPLRPRHAQQHFHRIGLDHHAGDIGGVAAIGAAGHRIGGDVRIEHGKKLQRLAFHHAIQHHGKRKGGGVAGLIEDDEAKAVGPVRGRIMDARLQIPVAAIADGNGLLGDDRRGFIGDLPGVGAFQIHRLKQTAGGVQTGVGVLNALRPKSARLKGADQGVVRQRVELPGPPGLPAEAAGHDRRCTVDLHRDIFVAQDGACRVEDLRPQPVVAIPGRRGQHQPRAVVGLTVHLDPVRGTEALGFGGRDHGTTGVDKGNADIAVQPAGQGQPQVTLGIDRRRGRGGRLLHPIGVGIDIIDQDFCPGAEGDGQ